MNKRIVNKVKPYINQAGFDFLVNLRRHFRSLKYARKYKKLVSGQGSLREIEVLAIEFCSVCNLKCRYCFLDKRDRPAFLNLDLYRKLLLELSENNRYRIKVMEWPISGCFFLHPEFKEVIKITKEFKQKYPDFRPWIILNDNMMLFDKDKADFIIEQGVVNQIICSIDGVDKETFERMRPQAEFDKVLENTGYLLNKNRESGQRIVIQVNNGRDEECFAKKLDLRLEHIFSQVDLVTNWEPLDWNESFHREQPCYAPDQSFCSFVFESVCLSASGAITKCCMDLKEATKYGDFNKNTLESIWFSKERLEFLRMMREGKRCLIPGCEFCSISYVSQNKFPK